MSGRFGNLVIGAALVTVLVSVAPALAGRRQRADEGSLLNASIPAADAAWLASSHPTWTNPTVLVELDGVYVSMGDSLPTDRHPVDDLRKALVGLPVSAWPHGRAVLLRQSSRVPLEMVGKPKPTGAAYDRLKATERVLKELGIEVVYAPI